MADFCPLGNKLPAAVTVGEITVSVERMQASQKCLFSTVAYPGIFFGGGVQQIQLRTEDGENGDLGAVAP